MDEVVADGNDPGGAVSRNALEEFRREFGTATGIPMAVRSSLIAAAGDKDLNFVLLIVAVLTRQVPLSISSAAWLSIREPSPPAAPEFARTNQ